MTLLRHMAGVAVRRLIKGKFTEIEQVPDNIQACMHACTDVALFDSLVWGSIMVAHLYLIHKLI